MALPLLQTKLFIPPVRQGWVDRPHLIARLNAGLGGRLTLISAPAGFGKTTLLVAWVQALTSSPLPSFPSPNPPPFTEGAEGGRERGVAEGRGEGVKIAWLSLDEDDNDPTRFLAYLTAALQSVAGPGTTLLEVLPQPSAAREFLSHLVNRVSTLPGRCVLILDDYHLVTAPQAHEAMAFLLDHLPENLHLVIATRVDPPLPLARLRGRGQLHELRQADLRFTPQEAADFLNRAMALDLAGEDAAALSSRTEGWIAGLQMAALALQAAIPERERDARRVAGFVAAFTGSDKYILDYLAAEVLQHQPQEIQAFLYRTAVLDRLSAPLCDAVLGESEEAREREGEEAGGREEGSLPRRFATPQSMLEYLERANLFIVPLDSRREWYRYHRLFADLLRKRLQQEQPEQVPVLHRRAGRWHEQNGVVSEAIVHTLAAGDFEHAADLIAGEAEAAMMRSEAVTLLRWVQQLPAPLLRAHARLGIYQAWALLLSNASSATMESYFREIDETTEETRSRGNTLRAFSAALQGRMAHAGALARHALEHLPPGDHFLRGMAGWIVAISQVEVGDIAAGRKTLDEITRTALATGNVMIAVAAQSYLAELYRREGQLHQSQATCERALALAADPLGRPLPIAGAAMTGLGVLAYEWNDLSAAGHYLHEAVGLLEQWGQIAVIDNYIYLARLHHILGQEEDAHKDLQKAHELAAAPTGFEAGTCFVELLQARFWIDQRNLAAAWQWARDKGLVEGTSPQSLERAGTSYNEDLFQHQRFVLARLWLAQDEPAQALAALEGLLPRVERQGRQRRRLETLTLQALAHQALGRLAPALDCLGQALALAEPEGYVRTFLDEGPALVPLLYEAAARGICAEYAGRLLASFPTAEPGVPAPEPDIVEPLSPRELQVLRLLAEGLSNAQIARQLTIALDTVKGHTREIYGKLGVNSRIQAVARARTLQLLD